jgi:hypothetical protein
MESRDYDLCDGRLVERVCESKRTIEKAAGTAAGLTTAVQVKIFEAFLRSL